MLKNKYVQIGIIVIIIIFVTIFIINDFYDESSSFENKSEVIATTTTLIGNTVVIEGTGNYEIKQIPIDDVIQELIYSELDRVLVFPDSFPKDARVIIQSNVMTLTAQLKTDATSFKNWLDLAIQYKIIEDYEGARDIWEFLNEASPKNSISFGNLGDLYHFYLKDFPKAEQNLRIAIENDKQKAGAYIALHELYKYSYKQDTTLVTDILLEGLTQNPNNIDLLTTLAVYHKEAGNTINAKKYYEQARDQAQNLDNTQLVDLLNTEISKL